MTCHEIEERLSELADGGLSSTERAEVDAHLNGCASCRGVLRDLQHVRRGAAGLGPIAPPDHVWLQVAGRARLERPASDPASGHPKVARRVAVVQWIGLAAALVIVTLGAYFVRTVPNATAPGNPDPQPAVQRIAAELGQAMQHYDNAITELEALMKSNGDVLGGQMAETLRQNLQTINAAIDESRAALEQNPTSPMVQESLFEALRRKVVVLQATVNLMNEMRKGNQTGAIEAAAAFGKKS
jgi:hypothetical protein